MGLLRRLVLLPLAPVEGATWLSRQLLAEAERQYYDEGAVQAALEDLRDAYEAGAISPEEHDEIEEQLLTRLIEARTRQTDSERGGTTWTMT